VKEAPAPRPEPKKGKIGKAYQFWRHEEDRKLIREIWAWLGRARASAYGQHGRSRCAAHGKVSERIARRIP
jgi:hypothetical protein